MTCPDLCTAAKCEELERRIGALEQALELLEASFEAHTQQQIPEAHDYTPNVAVTINKQGKYIYVDVEVDGVGDSDFFEDNHVKSNLKISGFYDSNKIYLTVADGESQDTEAIDLPEAPEPYSPERLRISHDIFEGTLATIVELDEIQSNVATVDLPVSQNLVVDADIYEGTLAINVTLDDLSDIATVDLPVFEPFVVVDIFLTNDNTFTVQVSVNGDSDSDSFTIEIPDMNCDELSRKLENCCDALTRLIDNSFNNLTNELNNLEDAINLNVNEVKDYVTVDISGAVESNYQCKFPQREDQSFIETYAESNTESVNYSGVGLTGIHENLKLINTNLTAMYADICKAIDPVSTIEFEDLYKYCYEDNDEIDRTIYFEEDGSEKFVDAAKRYSEAIQEYLTSLIVETKYGYLLDSREGDKLITAPNSYITKMLADFVLIQSKINNTAICKIDIPEYEEIDVVSIVASDKVIPNASGKFLVLHFVTLDNYPKRSRSSTYWQVQIPAAKENYIWQDDFIDLRFFRGNQYAELKFNEFRHSVSGFFADKNAANDYFDKVLRLTTATEKNRVYPEHKTPQTNVTQRITRPYRAFIESVNELGQAVCHVKYVPTDENGLAL